jgi:hypothetical protein
MEGFGAERTRLTDSRTGEKLCYPEVLAQCRRRPIPEGSDGRVHSLLPRHASVSPQELPRLQTPCQCLEGYLNLLRADVLPAPSNISNLAKRGNEDWSMPSAGINKRIVLIGLFVTRCCSGSAYCPLLLPATRAVFAMVEQDDTKYRNSTPYVRGSMYPSRHDD